MRISETKWLSRYARRERIADDSLKEAIGRAERGLVDADLGGGVKQRVPRAAIGCLLPTAPGIGPFYDFSKGERKNIGPAELLTLPEIGARWLAANADRSRAH